MEKESHYRMQLGPPNPLVECITQSLDTKVARKRCHMELFDDKLTRSTSFGNQNLVHSIRIVVCKKRYSCAVYYIKLRITGPLYTKIEPFHCHIHHAMHSISISRSNDFTNILLHAPMWYSADSWATTPRVVL